MEIKFSLCIPTMNRFDKFLCHYLEEYIQLKNDNIIDEIIVCDENGNDYDKIIQTYGEHPNSPIKVYKNEYTLGAFLNKAKVCTLANPNNFIALIDSDNFVDKTYFEAVKEYISKNQIKLSDHILLAPENAKPSTSLNFTPFRGIVTKNLLYQICNNYLLQALLNDGNYVFTPTTFSNLQYDPDDIIKAGPYDVVVKTLLAFQQIEDFSVHVIPNMEYLHVIHDENFYIHTYQQHEPYYVNTILPQFLQL